MQKESPSTFSSMPSFSSVGLDVSVIAKAATLSVIIPTLNEGSRLVDLLDLLEKSNVHEIIICDGGSSDKTLAAAEQMGVRVVSSASGRAIQMNTAAATATGELLLFLHADTVPPENFETLIQEALVRPGVSAGAFRFKLDGTLMASSLIEKFVHLRCRLFNTPYGDQGLFIRRDIFNQIGGYPNLPILEDLDIVRQLKRLGTVQTLSQSALTSPRRWQNGGTIRTFLRHQIMLISYYLGISPNTIAKMRSQTSPENNSRPNQTKCNK